MSNYVGCEECHAPSELLKCKWCGDPVSAHGLSECDGDGSPDRICLCTMKKMYHEYGMVLSSPTLLPGKWTFRGNDTYYCPHLTTVARSFTRPWYSDVAAKMNSRRES